jgi:hypothetical protein
LTQPHDWAHIDFLMQQPGKDGVVAEIVRELVALRLLSKSAFESACWRIRILSRRAKNQTR